MIYNFTQSIKNDFEGYKILIDFYNETKNLVSDEIILDFMQTKWFEANLSAILGAILSIVGNFNKLQIQNLSSKTKEIFERNHFLGHFGGLSIASVHKTPIEYKNLKSLKQHLFKNMLIKIFCQKRVFQKCLLRLKKKSAKAFLKSLLTRVYMEAVKIYLVVDNFFPKIKN